MTFHPTRRKRQRSGIRDSEGPVDIPSYEQWVRGLHCVLAGEPGHVCTGKIQVCHIRTGTDGGMGQKPSSFYVFPACAGAHISDQHQHGERDFQKRHGIDLMKIAEWCWTNWHGRAKWLAWNAAQDQPRQPPVFRSFQ
jgi:hypothetical protein